MILHFYYIIDLNGNNDYKLGTYTIIIYSKLLLSRRDNYISKENSQGGWSQLFYTPQPILNRIESFKPFQDNYNLYYYALLTVEVYEQLLSLLLQKLCSMYGAIQVLVLTINFCILYFIELYFRSFMF